MAVKDPNMQQAVRAAKYARDSGAPAGVVTWEPGYVLEWNLTTLLLKKDDTMLIVAPIGELADLEIE
jgi:hypothetical protein